MFLSSITQSHRAELLGMMEDVDRTREQELLCFIHDLVKLARIYSSRAKDVPSFIAQSRQYLKIICKAL
jgi:hypothetical protein